MWRGLTYGKFSMNDFRSCAVDNKIFGIQAEKFALDSIEKIVQPLPEQDGKIKTLNAMGYMTPEVDHIVQDFIEYAAASSLPVLDGGAAYGIATLLALKKGATVIANDIDRRHLQLIASNPTLTKEDKKRLYLNHQALPNKVNFPENSLGAILLCRIMHLFTPEAIDNVFENAKKWLVSNGRLYIVTMTPYHYVLQNFSVIYEKRLQDGQIWPGIITTMTKDYGVEHKGKIPDYLHVMDPRVMFQIATKHRFMVKRLELFGHYRNIQDNGLGYMGVILINQP